MRMHSREKQYATARLLAASAGFELTGIGSLDAAGSAFIAWLSWREGRESFSKARGAVCSCGGGCASAGAKG